MGMEAEAEAAAAIAISRSSSTNEDELFNLIINNYDTIVSASTGPFLPIDDNVQPLSPPQLPPQHLSVDHDIVGGVDHHDSTAKKAVQVQQEQQYRKRRRRRRTTTTTRNNKEVVEAKSAQRMNHITVERNRRKLMNHYLGVLRSLIPQSYLQRGDQASIVGGAIEYVKELEQLLHSLEAQKLRPLSLSQQRENQPTVGGTAMINNDGLEPQQEPSFAQFFVSPPQCTRSQTANCNKYTSKCKASMADIEVTLIQTHANIRILARKFLISRQLSKMVSNFTQTLNLSILHLNLTTFESNLVLCSISAKVEEGCQLTSADDIAGAIHTMFRIFEHETHVSVFDLTSA